MQSTAIIYNVSIIYLQSISQVIMMHFSNRLYGQRSWLKISCAATLSFALLFGCSDSLSPQMDGPSEQLQQTTALKLQTTSASSSQERIVLDAVARSLAKVISERQLRDIIKEEALRRFDGDYDILFSELSNKTVANQTIGKLLDGNLINGTLLSVVTKSVPLLNVSVPVNIDKWNTADYIPLIAVQSTESGESIKAYDSKGEVHYLDSKKEPNFPVIVVGLNERVKVENGQTILSSSQKSRLMDPGYRLFLQDPGDGSGGGGGGGGGGTTCVEPFRQDAKNEYLTGMFMNNVSDFEAWDRGCPEIRLRIFATSSSGNYQTLGVTYESSEMEPGSRSDISGNWWVVDYSLNYWLNSTYGRTWQYFFWEVDSGNTKRTIKISSNFQYTQNGSTNSTALETNTEIGGNDDEIGQRTVDQYGCPPYPEDGNAYGLTGFRFRSRTR